MNMDPEERERYLQLGRKMLEEKLGNIRKPTLPLSVSVPTVSEEYYSGSNNNYSLPNTPTKPSTPLNPDKYTTTINSPIKTPSAFYSNSQNYNSPYSSAPQSPLASASSEYGESAFNYSSPVNNSISTVRDQNSHNRMNELTRERAELSAELFKQKKTCEDLTNQNNQLRQRISNFEKALNQNQQVEERVVSVENENIKISELLKNEQAKNESLQENYEKAQQHIQSLSSEKNQLEQQLNEKLNTFQLTHDENQDHQKKLEEKNQQMQNEILRLQEIQRKSIEKSDELQSKNEKLTNDLKEKEQQLSIIFKEAEERQKVYQNTISLFNEKNHVIQQLNAQIDHLKNEVATSLSTRTQLQVQFDQFKIDAQILTENKQETIYQLQERVEILEKRIKENDNEKNNSRAVQEKIDNSVSTMNQLQDKIQSLTTENEKLKLTINSYTEIMENLQQSHAQIVETYEFKLSEFSFRHQEEIKGHLHLINQLQAQLLKPIPPSTPSNPSLESIQSELKALNELRESHKSIKQDPSLSIEELQEIKIQQLLEEISIMDDLLSKVPFFSAANLPSSSPPSDLLERIQSLENELNLKSNLLNNATQEVSALLLAIETGDLSAYAQLKLEQQQQTQEQQLQNVEENRERKLEVPSSEDPVPELISVDATPKPDAAPSTPSKKRFWFW